MTLPSAIFIAVKDKILRHALEAACARIGHGAAPAAASLPAPGGRQPYAVIADRESGIAIDDPAALACLIGGAESFRTGSSLRALYPVPFRLGAMMDRIAAHLSHRRAALWRPAEIFEIGKWYFIPDEMILRPQQPSAAGGDEVRLTEKERDILALLCGSPDEIVTRQNMLDDVWGYAPDLETHTLETHIYRLRQKLEEDPARPAWLLTEEGGYCLKISG